MKRSGRILAVAALGLSIVGRETPTLGAPAAQFTIVAAQGPTNGELNYDGASGRKLVITAPDSAQVKSTLQNQGALSHSLQLIPDTKQLPAVSQSHSVFTGAETPNPNAGMTKGQTQVAQFAVSKPGKYLLICGFPGHAIAGMCATFIVAPSSSVKPNMVVTQ